MVEKLVGYQKYGRLGCVYTQYALALRHPRVIIVDPFRLENPIRWMKKTSVHMRDASLSGQ